MERGALPHVRAALIAAALLAHCVHALPLPPELTAADVQEEWRQHDIRMWQGWLGSMGISVTEEQLEDLLLRSTQWSDKVDDTLEAPFDPVFDLLAIDQAWALFASATTRPDRLVVEVQRGETWEVVFRRLDPCCTWRDPVLRYRRIRGIWDGQKQSPRPAYRRLSRWIAEEAFGDFPDVDSVRVSLERTHTVYPWEEPDPNVEVRLQRSHRRLDR
jgi:hypothetical protein